MKWALKDCDAGNFGLWLSFFPTTSSHEFRTDSLSGVSASALAPGVSPEVPGL